MELEYFPLQIVREWNGDKVGTCASVDVQTLSQARAFITAGSCFAIGLRFSGSRDERARQCLVRHCILYCIPHTPLPPHKNSSYSVGTYCVSLLPPLPPSLPPSLFSMQLQVTKGFVAALRNHTEEAAGKHCLEQCLCTSLLALAMVSHFYRQANIIYLAVIAAAVVVSTVAAAIAVFFVDADALSYIQANIFGCCCCCYCCC